MVEQEVLNNTNSAPTSSGETVETKLENVETNQPNQTQTNEVNNKDNTKQETQENEDIDFDDLEDDSSEKQETTEEKTKKQSKAENRRYAEMRKAKREKEKQELEKQAYKKGVLEATNGLNPYTQEKIETDEDVEEFKIMQEMAKKGLDPIADFHKYFKQQKAEERIRLAKEHEEKTKQEAVEKEAQKRYESDIEDFKSKNADVDVNELLSNEKFLIFAEGKLGIKPLDTVYKEYLTFTSEFDTKAKETAKKMVAINSTSVGSLSGGKGDSKAVDFTNMSKAEFEEYLDKVKRGLVR
jgi:hypothetical protein